MAEHPNQVNGGPPHAGRSAAEVVGALLRDPVRGIVLKWNYKSAITSSLVRGIVFLLANLTAGLEAALLASAAEILLRFCTAGFYGALTQAFGEIRPARHGTLAAVVGLPVLSHTLEVALHVLRDTPNLALSIAASLVLTMGSTVFTLFAMRRGLLVVGVGDAQSLGADLRAMPALAREFARAVVTSMRRASSAAAVLLVFLTVSAGGRVVAAGTDDRPVRLFLDRAEPVLDAYVGRRHIEVVNARFNARGWMTVATTFDRRQGLTWTVIAEGGSKYIRDKVITRALETEVDAVRAGDPARSAVAPANYDFLVDVIEADGGTRIALTPKRRDRLLVRGLMRLGPDGDLLEIRGRLAKSPSLWTTWVDVVRRYARLNDIRLAVDTEAVSAVRVAGRSHLRVVYDYVTVNGVEVAANRRAASWPSAPWQPQ